MSADQAQQAFGLGNAAFVEEDFAGAVEHYSTAISHDDAEPEYYIKRAQAYLKLGKHTEAIMDTKTALEHNPTSARAHFRQGQAFFAAGNFEEAKKALTLAKAHGETHGDCAKLLENCHAALGTTPGEEDAAAAAAPSAMEVSSDPTPVSKTEELRIKHDWYQVAGWTTVDVFIKKADPANVSVEFTETTLSVDVKLPNGSNYNLEVDLYFKIVPDKSKFSVKGTKIEIRMAKKVQVQWPALEGEGLDGGEGPVVALANPEDAVKAKPVGYENDKKWEQLGAQIEEEEKNEKPEGDGALNKLFKDIYKNATPEQMRAMNKSYQESGGTVLSTNWDEIGKEKTQVKPPDGMEFKKWDS